MSLPLTPGFMVLQGNQLEDLRDVATQWLAEHPLGPLEDECILVQSNGIAQWLKLALATNAEGTGVAAAINVQLPGRFIWQAYRSVFPDLPSSSPYDKIPMAWRLYRLFSDWDELCEQLGEQATHLTPLEGFLHFDQDDPRRCYQLAMRLADLYDQYQMYRADWLAAWEQGQDLLIDAQGKTTPLAAEQLWQPLLWRVLVQDIGQDHPANDLSSASRSQIHTAFIQACRQYSPDNRPTGLPRRVIVFSISSLPRQSLELLEALSPFTQVMIFATNPCQHYWGDLVEGKQLLQREYRRIAERKVPTQLNPENLHAHGHPLLASWGKQGRDFLHLLDEHDQPEHYRELFNRHSIDLYSDPFKKPDETEDTQQRSGLLQQIQSDILNLRSLQERKDQNSQIDPEQDDSLQFLIAHSPQREVEILHDQLLRSFEQAKQQGDPLSPRDILVMVPDINLYAPHIHAVFGSYASQYGQPRDARQLPYHISDQSQRRQNTLLIALESLLKLPELRFSVSQLSDLLDTPAIRARFGLAEADLPALRRWIEGANIRWGLNAKQRGALDLPEIEQNSWSFGLRRMLLGYAAGDDSCWREIEGYDEVAGLEAALVGPLTRLLDNLDQARQLLQQEHTADHWPECIEQLLSLFFTESSKEDQWAIDRIQQQLELQQDIWQSAGLSENSLPLDVVREELLAGLDETNLSQKFLGGSINFATLMPMRAIPFKQLWLLGMNDRDYPRRSQNADFDLMVNDYRPGDRSRREDDRYLFLEALLSARDRLVISWVGRDIRDNSEKPASVLVNQLRDHIQAGWTLAGATADSPKEALLNKLTTAHPLQAFSRSYFEQGRDPRLFSYHSEWLQLHQPQDSDLLDHQLDKLPAWSAETAISLNDLAEFLYNPVRHFFSRRLGISFYSDKPQSLDSEPFAADHLEQWQHRKLLLEQACAELQRNPELEPAQLLAQQLERMQRAGELPTHPFDQAYQESLIDGLLQPLHDFQQVLANYPERLDSSVATLNSDSLSLHDSLSDIRHSAELGSLRALVLPNKLRDKSKKISSHHHIVRQWPRHLFAQLQGPVSTRLFSHTGNLTLKPMEKEQAEPLLIELLHSYQQGMNRPLPLPCKTALAWLLGNDPELVYEGGFQTSSEMLETDGLQKLWPSFEALRANDEFTQLAQSIYGPMLKELS